MNPTSHCQELPDPGGDETPIELRVRDAYERLIAGDVAGCLASLEHAGAKQDVVAMSLEAIARGLIAEAAGELDEAADFFERADALAVPLAGLLRQRGHYHKRRGRFDTALQCYALVEELQPGSMFEFLEGVPAQQACRAAPWMVSGLRAKPPRIYQLQPVKAALVSQFGETAAAFVLSQMLRPGKPWRLLKLPLEGLQEFARRRSLDFEELIAPKEVFMAPPAVFGGPALPGVSGRCRSVFVSVLPDMVVSSKSNLLLARDCAVMDYQGDELGQVAINMDADPIVLSARGPMLGILDQAEGARLPTLREGLSLVGIHSWNYGHWIFEFMFQVWACMDRPGFASVPLIVDAQMPSQLREALAFFVGADHPVVVLQPGESVRVERLWSCSKIAYWPGGERPGGAYPLVGELSDSASLARMVRKLSGSLHKIEPAPGQCRRIYLRRKDTQKRRVANRVEVEAWFASEGFELLDFDELTFVEQVRRIRGADCIVGPDGAAFYGLLFARPGTRIGMLTQPFLEGYEWWGQMYRELGLPCLVYPGQLHRLNRYYRSQSEISVDVTGLPAFVAHLEAMPLHGADDGRVPHPIRIASAPDAGSMFAAHDKREPYVIEGGTCRLQKAYAAVAAGNAAAAMQALESEGDRDNAVAAALAWVSQALEARAKGEADTVSRCMEQAFSCGVPLPAVLRECGRHFKGRGDFARAHICFAALQQLEPGAIGAYWHDLPKEWQVRHAPATMSWVIEAPKPLLYQLQRTKAALVEHWGEHAAAMLLAEALRPAAPWRLRRLRLGGLQEYARQHAVAYRELIPPREVHMAPPRVYGKPPLPGFTGTSRSVFMCVLPEVVVSSKSNLLMAPECMLLDSQGEELRRIAINPDTNPEVVSCIDGVLGVLDRLGRARKPDLDQAFCLTGLHTFSFGHWVFEFMFQVWAAMDQPGFEELPIIIDQQMPPQLREMLEFFLGPEHHIVVLKPGESVTVRRLWTCSKIAFWPGGEKLPAPPLNDYELSDTKALARIIERLQPTLDTVDCRAYPEKLYLTRSASQVRPLVNRAEVETMFARQGYAIRNFNDLSFIEQIRHLRAARVVVMEAGSTMYGALLCRRGTRIGEIVEENPTEHEWCAEMLNALGMQLLLFPCATVGTVGNIVGSLKIRADLVALEQYMAALES